MKTLLIPEPGDLVTLPGHPNVLVVEVLDANRFIYDADGIHRSVGYVRDISCYDGRKREAK